MQCIRTAETVPVVRQTRATWYTIATPHDGRPAGLGQRQAGRVSTQGEKRPANRPKQLPAAIPGLVPF